MINIISVMLIVILHYYFHSKRYSFLSGHDLESKFHLYHPASTLASSLVQLEDMSLDECATSCLGQASFTCTSFGYCYNTKTCAFSSDSPVTNSSLVVKNDYCDLYTSKFCFTCIHRLYIVRILL